MTSIFNLQTGLATGEGRKTVQARTLFLTLLAEMQGFLANGIGLSDANAPREASA